MSIATTNPPTPVFVDIGERVGGDGGVAVTLHARYSVQCGGYEHEFVGRARDVGSDEQVWIRNPECSHVSAISGVDTNGPVMER